MPSTGTPAATVSASRSHVAGSQGARSSSQALIRPPRTSSPTPGDVGTGSPAKGRTRWMSTPSSQPAKRSSGATVSCWSTVTRRRVTRTPHGSGGAAARNETLELGDVLGAELLQGADLEQPHRPDRSEERRGGE